MKKVSSFLAKSAYCLGALFLLYLVVNAVHYTFHFDLSDYFSNYVYEGPESRFQSLVLLIVFSGAYYGLAKLLFIGAKDDKSKNKRVFITSVVISSLVFVLLVIWVSYAKVLPWFDQETVLLTAQNFNAKDYFAEPSYWTYLQQYPQEFGLVFIEAMLLHIWNSFLFFEYINAFLIALIIFLSCRLCYELTGNPMCSFITLASVTCCLPLYYYVVFIYGDIFSIFGMLLVSLLSIKWLKTGKWRYIVPAIITACIMIPARKNCLIFFIALTIVFVLVSIKDKKILPAIMGIVMIVLPLLCAKGTQIYYETLADYKIGDSIPSINWIVMGLRGDVDDGEGVGFFDGYVYWDYNLLNQDGTATKNKAKKDLNDFFTLYKNDPSYAYRYFRYKTLEQWDEPTFASIYMTASTIDSNYEKMSLLYKPEVTARMHSFMAHLQIFVYVFSLIYCIYCIIKDDDYYKLIIAVTFIGGFLFSLLWEAGGRYVFPYFVFLIPAAGIGFVKALELINILFIKLKGQINGKSDKKLNSNA